jgi:hypothetical protein
MGADETAAGSFPENPDDEDLADRKDASSSLPSTAHDDQDMKKLRALLRYYSDGLVLCQSIQAVCTSPSMQRLLSSTKKSDVIESVNFYAACCMFGMSCAEPGMRAMVHRVWDREVASIKEVAVAGGSGVAGANDSGGLVMAAESVVVGISIREHLAQTYRDVYLK